MKVTMYEIDFYNRNYLKLIQHQNTLTLIIRISQ